MAGLDNTLTQKEIEGCNILKNRLDELLTEKMRKDESLYIRFLRARELNIDLAEKMLRNHISWRKQNRIDHILEEYTPDKIVMNYLPYCRIGYDKEGYSVHFADFGNTDVKGLLKATKTSVVIKSVMHYIEEHLKENYIVKSEKSINQLTIIIDYENFTLSNATYKPAIDAIIELFLCYEANYPERLKAVYAINASFYFTLLFAIIRPLLSGRTLSKLRLFGKTGWKEELCKVLDPEELPAFLGGKKTDPDGNPRCTTFVKHGAVVPEYLYMTKNANHLSEQPGVQKIIVPRMSKETLSFDVKHPGSTIEWEFETECRDINFGLLYKGFDDDKTKPEELIPKQRIDTYYNFEIGMFPCEKPGRYALIFDNTYSWIHQKIVYVKAKVVRPKSNTIAG